MRVERLEREFALDVEWQPFELHPEIPPEGKSLGSRGAAYYANLTSLAQQEGITLLAPERASNSHRSLEAAEFARDQGVLAPFHTALFEAYFSHGRDIGDIEVLADVAEANGLDAAALREALESKRYATLVDERTEEARQSGITGTPTFVFQNGERRLPIVGAQEYALFASVAQRMGAQPRI